MGQTRSGSLSDWKGSRDAEAGAQRGLWRRGSRAPTSPARLPSSKAAGGFFAPGARAAPPRSDIGAFGSPTREFRIHRVGMKPYPVVVHAQTSIPAGIALAKAIGDLDRIAGIEIAATRRGYQMAGSEPEKWAPQTRETADHSLPYIAARAMLDGDIGRASFTPDKLREPRVLALMHKITVKADPALDTFPGAPPVRITAVLQDGQRVVQQVDNMPGFPGQPMTRADVERKFRGNVEGRWPRERTAEVLQALWALDRPSDLSALLGQMIVQPIP